MKDDKLNETSNPGNVKSASRALIILEILGEAQSPVLVTDLHKATGYPRSSLHQLLQTLVSLEWVDKHNDGASVAIGARALLVGTSYLDRDPALQFSRRTLERIRDEVGYTTHYARLHRATVLYLATREATESRRITSRVGRQLPAYATALGKALLADLTNKEASLLLPQRFVPLTPGTVSTHDEFYKQLEGVRERGYAVEFEENTLGVVCVSSTVPYRIPGTDAISCSIPSTQATDSLIDQVAKALVAGSGALALQLRTEGIR